MIGKLDIGRIGLVADTRAVLAGALWIAACVALGGCASQRHASYAPPPAAVTERAPGFSVGNLHEDLHLELPMLDQRGEGDIIPRQAGQCERKDDDEEAYRSMGARTPHADARQQPECEGPITATSRGQAQLPAGRDAM